MQGVRGQVKDKKVQDVEGDIQFVSDNMIDVSAQRIVGGTQVCSKS